MVNPGVCEWTPGFFCLVAVVGLGCIFHVGVQRFEEVVHVQGERELGQHAFDLRGVGVSHASTLATLPFSSAALACIFQTCNISVHLSSLW